LLIFIDAPFLSPFLFLLQTFSLTDGGKLIEISHSSS
jgi:hypothetical protein